MTGLRRIFALAAVALAVACNDNELLPTDPGTAAGPGVGVAGGSPAYSIGVGSLGETIATDKNDYAPGQTVTITGTGWEPGETVRLLLTEEPVVHGPREWDVQVDSAGEFTDTSFAPEEHHLGVTFTLTATGLTSGRSAQTTFTDISKFWAGCADRTDWNNTNNWTTESSGVVCTSGVPTKSGNKATAPPTATDAANIPNTSDLASGSKGYPQITNAASSAISDLTVHDGATFEVATSGSLTVNNLLETKSGTTVTLSGGSLVVKTRMLMDGLVTQSGGTLEVGAPANNTNNKIFELKSGRTFNQGGGLIIMLAAWKNQGTFNSTGGTVEFRGNAGSDGNSFPSGTNRFFDVRISGHTSPTNAQVTGTPGFDNNSDITIIVRGNWDNDGNADLTGRATVVEAAGTTGQQTIGGTNPTNFRHLRINNAGGVQLVDNVNQTVVTPTSPSGTLTFLQGNVTTNANVLIIAAGSSVARPNSIGHVVGNLRKAINATGAVNRTYEVGTGSNYTPVDVILTGVLGTTATTTSNFLTASSTAGDHPDLGTSDINPSKSVNRHWTLTPIGPWTFTNYDARLHFVTGDVDAGANTADFVVRKFAQAAATAWSSPPAGSVAATTSTTGNDFTTFSDFAVGSTAPSDATAPGVTVTQASGQADPTNASPIKFSVEFTEAVTGFAGTDVSFEGSTVDGTLSATAAGGPIIYNVEVTGMTGTGTVVASIPAGVATDGAGNANTASSTGTDNSVTFDGTPPTVTIKQASGQDDPTSASTINFTVEFSEMVSDFATGDVTLSGTAGANTAVVTGGGTTYNVAVSGMTGDGTVIASVGANVAHDAIGNGNTASGSTDDNSVTFMAGPTKLAYTTAAHEGVVGQCLGPITVQTQNASGNPRNVASNLTVNLATDGGTNGGGTFYSDNGCGSAITNVLIASGTNSASFRYKPTARGSGTHELTASAVGLTSATQPQTINKADQTITFSTAAPTNAVFGGSYAVAASASSLLAVSFSSMTQDVCTVNGTVNFVGVGTCTVAANQAGNGDYNAADQVTQSFEVGKAPQSISFDSDAPTNAIIGQTYQASATATSGLAVTFSSLTPGVCSVSGSTVSFVGVGSCTVAADQAGNNNYSPAPQATQSFTVKYIFSGFFAPVDWPTTVNIAKAGQAIPLKWRLTDINNVGITNLASVIVKASPYLGCASSTATDPIEEYAGSSGLQNLGDGYYQFNWKTPTGYANSCKTIGLDLGGYTESPTAIFTFKK